MNQENLNNRTKYSKYTEHEIKKEVQNGKLKVVSAPSGFKSEYWKKFDLVDREIKVQSSMRDQSSIVKPSIIFIF